MRSGPARGLCVQDDWRTPRGKLCLASASKALSELAARLGLSLASPSRRPVALPETLAYEKVTGDLSLPLAYSFSKKITNSDSFENGFLGLSVGYQNNVTFAGE